MSNRKQDMKHDIRKKSSRIIQMDKEAGKRSAHRRAAAARRHRLLEGDHQQAYKNLHERLERISEARMPRKDKEGKTVASRRKSDRWKMRSMQLVKAALLAVCLAAILCFSPLTEIFHTNSDQVEASALVEDVRYQIVEIRDGDSLWSIAKTYYEPEHGSIPAMVEEIKECNSLKGDRIYAGSYLMVPLR